MRKRGQEPDGGFGPAVQTQLAAAVPPPYRFLGEEAAPWVFRLPCRLLAGKAAWACEAIGLQKKPALPEAAARVKRR